MSDVFASQGEPFGRQGGPGRRRGAGRAAKFGGFGPPIEGGGFEAGGGFPPGFRHGHWHGGPPPWAGGRRARRGDVRWALLIALLDGPAHGYELIGRLEARAGGLWRPSAGSVYPTLQLLEEEGLITGSDEGGKRVFALTDTGRSAASEASERISRGPWAAETSAGHAELRDALRSLLMAVRQVTAVGDDGQVAAAGAVITDARQRLYRVLAGDPAADRP